MCIECGDEDAIMVLLDGWVGLVGWVVERHGIGWDEGYGSPYIFFSTSLLLLRIEYTDISLPLLLSGATWAGLLMIECAK